MLNWASWVLGAVVAAGLALSCLWLMERPVRGAARLGSLAHGAAGAVGVALVWTGLGADGQGFGHLAAWALALTLAAGLAVLATQMRRQRPAGLLVALHAVIGVGGFVMLLAYASLPP